MYVVQQKKKKKNPNHKERRQKWTSKKSQIWQNRKSNQYVSLQEERHAIKYRKDNKFSRSSNLNLYTKQSR